MNYFVSHFYHSRHPLIGIVLVLEYSEYMYGNYSFE